MGSIFQDRAGARGGSARGFSLFDLLVSMAVLSLLVAVLLPAIMRAKERANVVRCANNLRQLGLAQQMFAFDHDGRLPTTVFSESDETYVTAPEETIHLRVDGSQPQFAGGSGGGERWDGTGKLFGKEYVAEPQMYYCPAYAGEHTLERYQPRFLGESGPILGNYQYRLVDDRMYLSNLPPRKALLTNSMRTPQELAHEGGMNVQRADGSVEWLADASNAVSSVLTVTVGRVDGAEGRRELPAVERVWLMLDEGSIVPPPPDNGSRGLGGDGDLEDSGHKGDGQVERDR